MKLFPLCHVPQIIFADARNDIPHLTRHHKKLYNNIRLFSPKTRLSFLCFPNAAVISSATVYSSMGALIQFYVLENHRESPELLLPLFYLGAIAENQISCYSS